METQILKFWQKYFQVFEYCLQGMMVNHYEKKIFFKLGFLIVIFLEKEKRYPKARL